ncbi:Ig-like domain-containing protein [Niveibacterium umoris]|uniref:Protocatechuate 3,4-dioxygenase beta subunit n=3 Tax=Niveibacterium umoris TaxID=1193620 RepID=A0A840BSJ8_9RHOO|nr:Ig-like domain-containing protein [Niveibacterium umoris]MBB4013337.1 protocatechuate 3,4-dioxygenase beta subunit [Niveibacterium umoris]
MLKRLLGWSALILGSAVLLGGCGGGSGACGLPDCGTTKPNPDAAAYVMKIATYKANGDPFDNVTDGLVFPETTEIRVTVTDKAGVAVPAQIVTATVSDPALAALTASTALTDSTGMGKFKITAAASSSTGAVTFTAKATIVNGTTSTDVSQPIAFRINEKKFTTTPGEPAYVRYVSATPTRIFVKGGALGAANASEKATVTFKVFDSNNTALANKTVYFTVTRRNGGILTNGNDGSVDTTVKTDADGLASVTVTAGVEPISINVIAWAVDTAGTTKTPEVWSDDQIVISGRKPDQTKFFMLWDSGATCNKLGDRTYPCLFTVYVADEKGDPVADGTVVNMVSDTGVVVATKLAGQPSGACLTVNSQCSANYTGKGTVSLGKHHIIAYSVGNYLQSPLATPKGYASEPITIDGSWVANALGLVSNGGNVIVNNKPVDSSGFGDADYYVRNCLSDTGTEANMKLNTCIPKD